MNLGLRKGWAERALGLLSVGALGACSPHFADAIVRPETSDPCLLLSATDCLMDSVDGCSLQPNPTGCRASDATCGAGVCRGGVPFVARSGEALFLGQTSFHFLGTVSWQIAWQDGGCRVSGFPNQESALAPFFDELASMHVSVLRFWAFQSYAGATGTDYSHFDRIVLSARAAGIRLMPVLESYHPDCTASSARDDTWFATGYKLPYGNYALSYRDYVAGVVTHFRDEPTILAWELMHEAGGNDFSIIDAFAQDMTTWVKRNDHDPHHLIALGLNNGDKSPATSTDGDPSNYFKLQNRDTVDLIDVHDFGAPGDVLPAQIARCREIAHSLKKPIFSGASAVPLSDASAASFQLRASQIQSKYAAAQADDFAGFLVYDFVPGWTNPSWDFDARPEEPLAGPGGVLDQLAPRF
jgi:hypothetical protein